MQNPLLVFIWFSRSTLAHPTYLKSRTYGGSADNSSLLFIECDNISYTPSSVSHKESNTSIHLETSRSVSPSLLRIPLPFGLKYATLRPRSFACHGHAHRQTRRRRCHPPTRYSRRRFAARMDERRSFQISHCFETILRSTSSP